MHLELQANRTMEQQYTNKTVWLRFTKYFVWAFCKRRCSIFTVFGFELLPEF